MRGRSFYRILTVDSSVAFGWVCLDIVERLLVEREDIDFVQEMNTWEHIDSRDSLLDYDPLD
jgi:hypothetical protein